MGKPLYPEAQAEANKTAAYKGGEISALQGTQVVIFKARLQRGKWQWSATKSTAAGTVERQEEHRARWREEQSRNPNEYLARKNAEYNTTFTSRWLLHRHLYPDYPSRGSREERLLVLKQPVWSELVAASLSISSAMSTKQEQRANEMAEWLRARGLGELEETFSANQIDLQVHTLTL